MQLAPASPFNLGSKRYLITQFEEKPEDPTQAPGTEGLFINSMQE